ncbi:MAG TPA: lactate racemase domain-containing protein [Pirellulales bacterium]|jgi:nickel-dependent lactate racemase|nr:lactate racemase domain-containing protein [Pirellulales bacterium]
MPWIAERADSISYQRLELLMDQALVEARRRICARPRRVLLLPPDITRAHSGAGRLTEMLFDRLSGEAEVHVIPTLGQHVPHTPAENRRMFGAIPNERIHAHDWRAGCVTVGEISGAEVAETSGGIADWPLPISLNRMLMTEPWDLVINVGHVVPHEVLGFANHNKNYFIGLGGKDLICAAHLMAASCGIENNLGNLVTPVRECFNRAEDRLLGKLPDFYVQVVMARDASDALVHTGVYVGDDLETYLAAARQSREQNITVFDKPVKKMVCVMQEDEFVSTWVANKAVYRTRMALADDGELLIIAPGLKRFGEQPEVDALIRKYGYVGTPRVLEGYRRQADMHDLAHATAHLIHGSSEGRFRITYAPGFLTQAEIEGVNFGYADLQATLDRYHPERLNEGWHRTADGEDFFFIPTPSAGLWATRDKLYNRPTGFSA